MAFSPLVQMEPMDSHSFYGSITLLVARFVARGKAPSLPAITALNLLAYGLPRLCRWPGRYYDLPIDKALFSLP